MWSEIVVPYEAAQARELLAGAYGDLVDPDAAELELTAALECACFIQRSLRDHRRDHGCAPRVRIGAHSMTAPIAAARDCLAAGLVVAAVAIDQVA
jgi:hypothetical protein